MEINGIVKEVYIPTEKNQDIMCSDKIGFKIQTDNGIINIIEPQNDYNSQIYKDDEVVIIKRIIDGIEFTDIEKVGEFDD